MKKIFLYTDEKSNKFWTIETNANEFTVTYGKVGAAGQTQNKSFSSATVCEEEAEKLIKSKMSKGYVEENNPSEATLSAATEKKKSSASPKMETSEKTATASVSVAKLKSVIAHIETIFKRGGKTLSAENLEKIQSFLLGNTPFEEIDNMFVFTKWNGSKDMSLDALVTKIGSRWDYDDKKSMAKIGKDLRKNFDIALPVGRYFKVLEKVFNVYPAGILAEETEISREELYVKLDLDMQKLAQTLCVHSDYFPNPYSGYYYDYCPIPKNFQLIWDRQPDALREMAAQKGKLIEGMYHPGDSWEAKPVPSVYKELPGIKYHRIAAFIYAKEPSEELKEMLIQNSARCLALAMKAAKKEEAFREVMKTHNEPEVKILEAAFEEYKDIKTINYNDNIWEDTSCIKQLLEQFCMGAALCGFKIKEINTFLNIAIEMNFKDSAAKVSSFDHLKFLNVMSYMLYAFEHNSKDAKKTDDDDDDEDIEEDIEEEDDDDDEESDEKEKQKEVILLNFAAAIGMKKELLVARLIAEDKSAETILTAAGSDDFLLNMLDTIAPGHITRIAQIFWKQGKGKELVPRCEAAFYTELSGMAGKEKALSAGDKKKVLDWLKSDDDTNPPKVTEIHYSTGYANTIAADLKDVLPRLTKRYVRFILEGDQAEQFSYLYNGFTDHFNTDPCKMMEYCASCCKDASQGKAFFIKALLKHYTIRKDITKIAAKDPEACIDAIDLFESSYEPSIILEAVYTQHPQHNPDILVEIFNVEESDPGFRLDALNYLYAGNPSHDPELLIAHLSETKKAVRERVLELLMPMPHLRDRAQELLKDKKKPVREAAEKLLMAWGKAAPSTPVAGQQSNESDKTNTGFDVADFIKTNAPKNLKKFEWAGITATPAIRCKGSEEFADEKLINAYLNVLLSSKDIEKPYGAAQIKEMLNEEDMQKCALDVYHKWLRLERGQDTKRKGALVLAALHGGDSVLDNFLKNKGNFMIASALALHGSPIALMSVYALFQNTYFDKRTRDAAEKGFYDAARAKNMTKEEFADYISADPTCNSEALLPIQIERLEATFMGPRVWNFDNWQKLFSINPLMKKLAESLLWTTFKDGIFGQTFRFADGILKDIDGNGIKLNNGELITLAHPLETPPDVIDAWKKVFAGLNIVQPFAQLERAVYKVSEDSAEGIERFAGKKMNGSTLKNNASTHGWKKGEIGDGGGYYQFVKYIDAAGFDVEFNMSGLNASGFGDSGSVTVYNTNVYLYIVENDINSRLNSLGHPCFDPVYRSILDKANHAYIKANTLPARFYSELCVELDKMTSSSKRKDEDWRHERDRYSTVYHQIKKYEDYQKVK